MKNRIVFTVAVISTTLLIALIGSMFWADSNDDDSPPNVVFSIDPNCHPETSYSTGLANTPDGAAWYHTCVQNHGPFFLWRNGKLVLRGQYVNGKRQGLFTEYAADGSVIKETHYVDGKEVKQ